jgi:hypothetical protein
MEKNAAVPRAFPCSAEARRHADVHVDTPDGGYQCTKKALIVATLRINRGETGPATAIASCACISARSVAVRNGALLVSTSPGDTRNRGRSSRRDAARSPWSGAIRFPTDRRGAPMIYRLIEPTRGRRSAPERLELGAVQHGVARLDHVV